MAEIATKILPGIKVTVESRKPFTIRRIKSLGDMNGSAKSVTLNISLEVTIKNEDKWRDCPKMVRCNPPSSRNKRPTHKRKNNYGKNITYNSGS
jgi:hypothetical protein